MSEGGNDDDEEQVRESVMYLSAPYLPHIPSTPMYPIVHPIFEPQNLVPPPPRVCISIHPEDKSCSDIGWSACCQ